MSLSCFLRAHNSCELRKVLKHHLDLLDEATQDMQEKNCSKETDGSCEGKRDMELDGSSANDSNTDRDRDCERGDDITISSRNPTPKNVFHSEGEARKTTIPEEITGEMVAKLTEEGNGLSGSWGPEWGDGLQASIGVTTRSTNDEHHKEDFSYVGQEGVVLHGGVGGMQVNTTEQA